MSKVFVVQSEQGHYFSKHGLWLSGKEPQLLYYGKYRDEALNQLIDITLKDVNVRARVVEVDLHERKYPLVDIVVSEDLITDEDMDNTLQVEAASA